MQRFPMLGIFLACHGKHSGKIGCFVVERERESWKDSAGRPRDDIVREGFFRRVFPGRLFFSLSRIRRDKPPSDVLGEKGVLPRRRRGNGHVKNGKLNRRRINSRPKINALYVSRAQGHFRSHGEATLAFRTCTRVTTSRCDSRQDWIRARKAPRVRSSIPERNSTHA